MISFKLCDIDFNYLGTEYDVIKIDNTNFQENIHHITETINNFNLEIKWNDMFNLGDVKDRLSNDMTMYIGVIENKPFGHLWFKDYLDGRLSFNLFVRNKVKDKKYTGAEFISYVLKKYELSKSPIYCEIDEWNQKSINLFEKLGFKLKKDFKKK